MFCKSIIQNCLTFFDNLLSPSVMDIFRREKSDSGINVIDLTDRFITGVEALFLDAVFSWIFSAWPDGFNGRDEQVKQFV